MRFKDREHAGKLLAKKLSGYRGRRDAVVLGIPRGGIPVAYSLARELKLPLDVVISRKLPLPWDTEASFGAIAEGGVVIKDDMFLRRMPKGKLNHIIRHIKGEVSRRVGLYRQGKPLSVRGKTAIIVDDGIAGGWTIAAAIRAVEKQKPVKVIVAVPCASSAALESIGNGAEILTLCTSDDFMFTTASCYRNYAALDDEQALKYMGKGEWPFGVVKKIVSRVKRKSEDAQ